ncbi:MAG: hypothetical protein AAFY91_10705 [Bacteroidota bacterium]
MNTKTIALLLIGVGGLFYLNQQNRFQQRFIPGQTFYPPPPPRNAAQAWSTWAAQMLQIYGNVRELWQPGGPFHNIPEADVIDAIQMPDNGPIYV